MFSQNKYTDREEKTDKTTAARTRLLTFDVFSHVVVNDHGDVLDVDTSTSNVCGHQDIFGSCLEIGESELSLLLAFATVQRASIVLCEEETTKIKMCSYSQYFRTSSSLTGMTWCPDVECLALSFQEL